MKPRLFNVKYSPNLGDGLLSECLEKALWEYGADRSATYSVDLGGRVRYSSGSPGRGRMLHALLATPPLLRRPLSRLILGVMSATRWRPHYNAQLRGADAIVIGGGNLFTDMDLNFPVKVSSALDVATEHGLPAAIYGVGVSGEWSAAGLAMMRGALKRARLCYVSVRDEASKASFDRLFGDTSGREAIVVRDPGLLVSRYVPARPRDPPARVVGICVTSPVALNYHSDFNTSDEALEAWYRELFGSLADAHCSMVAFTNGSPEDDEFLDRITDRLQSVAAGSLLMERPRTPAALAGLIGSLSFLVAHRMHALIAAYSYGVPIFALEWDRKVNAFMSSVGMKERLVRAGGETHFSVATAVKREIDAGPADHREMIEEAYRDVGALARALGRSQ